VAHERPPQRCQARIDADQLDRLAAARTTGLRARFQQRRGRAHAGDGAHPREHPRFKTLRRAREQLQRGVADDPLRELGHGAREARGGDLGGEQQRHAGGDPDDREALLQQARAQAHAIQVQDVARLHRWESRSDS
jgi:hypothetical protein